VGEWSIWAGFCALGEMGPLNLLIRTIRRWGITLRGTQNDLASAHSLVHTSFLRSIPISRFFEKFPSVDEIFIEVTN
jgi:hypothetical protein